MKKRVQLMSPAPEPSDQQSPSEASHDVWQRLRDHLQHLQSMEPGKVDTASLNKRLTDRAKMLRQRMQRPQVENVCQSFLMFNKQQERYGVPLDDVAAVEALEHFTPVPHTAHFIRGVTPWRGSILSLVDLGRLFGSPESGIADLRACVIVETAGHRLAIVAHEVEEIISLRESEIAPAPDLPAEIAPEWVIGVHEENRLLLRISDVIRGIENGIQTSQS